MTNREETELHRLSRSFRYAFDGIFHVVRTQRNARIHGAITVMVVALGFWLHLTNLDWAVLILTMTIVWVSEFFNTALEVHVDLTTPEKSASAKIAKDVAAAAVLVASVGAVIIGLIILGPPLFERLF